MLPILKYLPIFAISLVTLGTVISQPGWSDVPAAAKPALSESMCLKLFKESISNARAGNWQTSAQDRQIFKQCREQFAPPPNPNAPLPSAAECVSLVKAVFQVGGDLSKLAATDLQPDRLMSMERCSEVVKSYYIPAGSMLPTLKINDRIIIDTTAYKSRAPQRGDIILFNPTEQLRREKYKDPFIKRIIGLPGETVKITNGKVYVNGKLLNENYLDEPPQYEYQSDVIPKNSYFVLGDNRNNSYDSHYWGSVPRNLIVGKLIWKLESK